MLSIVLPIVSSFFLKTTKMCKNLNLNPNPSSSSNSNPNPNPNKCVYTDLRGL